jgi:hypothetical protein
VILGPNHPKPIIEARLGFGRERANQAAKGKRKAQHPFPTRKSSHRLRVTSKTAGAGYGYDCLRSRVDWEDVQKAAFRVDSGLRHETLILLRFKVADLDAALSHYVAAGAIGVERIA